MNLSPFDMAIVLVYIVLVYGIAIRANRFMSAHGSQRKDTNLRVVENHYIAGKTITFFEAMMSIVASEFSAMALLIIPTYVYLENFSYLRFVIGACLSRALIAFYFLPLVYGKGLTIFEVLARGINNYKVLRPENMIARKWFAFIYLITKLIGVSVKLLGGAILLSEFFELSLFMSIVLVSTMTYIYILLGGLKAVVRTDIMQASIFIIGGFAAHYVVGNISTFTWGELFSYGIDHGKLKLWTGGMDSLNFLYGILAGVAYDAATHGVDQDQAQKLFGARSMEVAQKALAWSALGSFIVNMLFLTLGVVVWSYYTRQGVALPEPNRLFTVLIIDHFPSPLKGLMVASILAACMSTLDSSINALSSVFWNDLLSIENSRMINVYINMDNFIITLAIVMVSYLFSLIPGAMKFGLQFAYFATAPLLAFFMCRMMLFKYIKVTFSPILILLSLGFTIFGMALNHFRLGFNHQLTILWGITTTLIFMWSYSKVNDYFEKSEREV